MTGGLIYGVPTRGTAIPTGGNAIRRVGISVCGIKNQKFSLPVKRLLTSLLHHPGQKNLTVPKGVGTMKRLPFLFNTSHGLP